MHAEERERLILEVMQPAGFVSFRDLEARLHASPATIRRDLTRLESAGRITRVHGGGAPRAAAGGGQADRAAGRHPPVRHAL